MIRLCVFDFLWLICLRIIISDEEHIYLRTECLDVLLEFNEFFTDKNYYYVDSDECSVIDSNKNEISSFKRYTFDN